MNINCGNWNTELSLSARKRDGWSAWPQPVKMESHLYGADTSQLSAAETRDGNLGWKHRTERTVGCHTRPSSISVRTQQWAGQCGPVDVAWRGKSQHSTVFLFRSGQRLLSSVPLRYFTWQHPDRRKVLHAVIGGKPVGNLFFCWCFFDRQIRSTSVAAALVPVPSSLK